MTNLKTSEVHSFAFLRFLPKALQYCLIYAFKILLLNPVGGWSHFWKNVLGFNANMFQDCGVQLTDSILGKEEESESPQSLYTTRRVKVN